MLLEKVNPPQDKDKVGKEGGSCSQRSVRVLSSNVLKTTANFTLGLHVFFSPPQVEACAMKCLALIDLGTLFAFAPGFLLVNYINSFIIAKEIDIPPHTHQFLPTISVAGLNLELLLVLGTKLSLRELSLPDKCYVYFRNLPCARWKEILQQKNVIFFLV